MKAPFLSKGDASATSVGEDASDGARTDNFTRRQSPQLALGNFAAGTLAWITSEGFNGDWLISRSARPRGRPVMLFRSVLMLAMIASAPALATTADDVAWIDQCVQDNKEEGAKEEVILKYCTCMNEQMDDNENASISEWEKSHPDERKTCEKEAGWR